MLIVLIRTDTAVSCDILTFFRHVTGDGAGVVEAVGATLIRECCDDRQIRALKSLGGNLYHFLTTLDGVHDVLQMGDGKVTTIY